MSQYHRSRPTAGWSAPKKDAGMRQRLVESRSEPPSLVVVDSNRARLGGRGHDMVRGEPNPQTPNLQLPDRVLAPAAAVRPSDFTNSSVNLRSWVCVACTSTLPVCSI